MPAVPGHTAQSQLAPCEREYRFLQNGELPCQNKTKRTSVVCLPGHTGLVPELPPTHERITSRTCLRACGDDLSSSTAV